MRNTQLAFRKAGLAIVLSVVIGLSLIALIQLEKNSLLSINLNDPSSSNLSPHNQFRLWANPSLSFQPVFEDTVRETQLPIISNSTRTEIYTFIVANPGIQFRGICSGLGVAIGTAEFHLGVLKKAGLISFVYDGKYKRFFASKKFSAKEMKLISLLRHNTIREILKTIIAKKTASHSKLASNLCITSQGLTWQMNRLRAEEVIQEQWDGMAVTYSLSGEWLQTLPELIRIIEQ